jgi:hypothetical protein
MPKKYNPFKERFAWWTHPWLLALLGIEAVMVYGAFIFAYSYVDLTSGIMLGMVFCILSVVTVVLFRNVTIEPDHSIDGKIINATHRELTRDRSQAQRDFAQTEIAMLKAGKRIPVLETVLIDEQRRKVHPYYSAVEKTEIDPVSREFFIKIQVGHIDLATEREISSRPQFLKSVVAILRALPQEFQLQPLISFFSTFVVEVDSLFEDELGRDNPYPLLSLTFPKESLPLLNCNISDLKGVSDLRYKDGKPVEPHRGPVAPSA